MSALDSIARMSNKRFVGLGRLFCWSTSSRERKESLSVSYLLKRCLKRSHLILWPPLKRWTSTDSPLRSRTSARSDCPFCLECRPKSSQSHFPPASLKLERPLPEQVSASAVLSKPKLNIAANKSRHRLVDRRQAPIL